LFINNVIHKFTEPDGGPLIISSNLEESLNASEVLRPLMLIDLQVSTNSGGVITVEAIDNAIENRSGETETFLHILSVADDAGRPVSYIRENDFYKFEQNEFKKTVDEYKGYRIGAEGIRISPIEDSGAFTVSVIKAPKPVNYDTLDSTDLPETVHDVVLAKALELAGLASHDEALIQMRNVV